MAGEAYTSYSDIVNKTTTEGKVATRLYNKVSSAPEAAGQMHTLWKAAGLVGAGVDPATTPGTAYDDAAGSMTLPDQATYKFLLRAEVMSTVSCTLLLFDRLVGVSGLALGSTGNKTVSSAALPRYTDGVGVEALLELTTASSANVGVVSMNSYTDTDNNDTQAGGNVTFTAAAQNVDSLFPLPLAAGDVGVKAVATINVGTATTGGVANLLLVKQLAMIPAIANIATLVDFTRAFAGPPRIYDGASLFCAFIAGGTGAHTIRSAFTFGWG